MPIEGWVKVSGVWREIDDGYVKVTGTWRQIDESFNKIGGVWHGSGTAPPACPGPGQYEPPLVSGGGNSGGTFNMTGYAGCGITGAFAKIGFGVMPGVIDTSVNVAGSPSGTFYRSITITEVYSGRTIFFDLGATAAAQFESGAATGYSITLSGNVWIVSSRLRVDIA